MIVTGIRDIVPRALQVSVTAALAVSCLSCAPSKPALRSGPDAAVTYDGLYRVDNTRMDAAWMKPDLDLTGYTGLLIIGAGMSFKAVDDEGRARWPAEAEFPIGAETRERLQEVMRQASEEELSKLRRYELVGKPGHGVLTLSARLIDVVSRVPPADECVERCDLYLTEIGEATLLLELRDSVTNEVLARAADRRAPDPSHWPIEANSVRSWSEVRQLAESWARLVREGLEELDSITRPAD